MGYAVVGEPIPLSAAQTGKPLPHAAAAYPTLASISLANKIVILEDNSVS